MVLVKRWDWDANSFQRENTDEDKEKGVVMSDRKNAGENIGDNGDENKREPKHNLFFVGDLFRYYNYEKDYKDNSITGNTTCLMRIYA
ncbi:hypothetical protein YC2023_122483 [Brassica napus]